MAFTKRLATLALYDGTPTLIATLADVGDFTFGDVQEGQRAAVPIMNRGIFAGYVEGDDVPVPVSFSHRVKRETFTAAGAYRFFDAIRKLGDSASDVSDNAIATGPMAWQLKYNVSDGTNTAAQIFTQCRLVASFSEDGDTLMWSVSGTALDLGTTT